MGGFVGPSGPAYACVTGWCGETRRAGKVGLVGAGWGAEGGGAQGSLSLKAGGVVWVWVAAAPGRRSINKKNWVSRA